MIAIIKIPDHYKNIPQDYYNLPDAVRNGTILPDNATNGDIYMAIFKPYKIKLNGTCIWIWYTEEEYDNGGTHYTMSTEWWNAPYKKEQNNGTKNSN